MLPAAVLAIGVVVMLCILPSGADAGARASVLIWLLGMVGGFGTLLLIWAVLEAACTGYGIVSGERPVPPSIGRLVRIMITMQAAWIVWFLPPEGFRAPLVLTIMLILRLCAARLSRRVSGS